ncbi:MAG: hypothetical protein WB711_19400, partial [Terriglobales bacterium]
MERFYREGKEFVPRSNIAVIVPISLSSFQYSCHRSNITVILSEVTASQREAVTQSKDPAALGIGTMRRGILTV